MASIQTGSYREDHGTQSSTTPFGRSFPVTVAAGTDRCLVVVISSLQQQLTDFQVSYGGTPMTGLYAQVGGSAARHQVWYLLNPPVGTADVDINLSGWYGIHYTTHAVVLDGVSSAAQFKTPVSISNPFGSSPVAATIAASAGELVIGVYGVMGPGAITIGSGETAIGPSSTEANNQITSQLVTKAAPATSLTYSFTGSPQPSLLGLVVSASGGGGATVTGVTVSPASPTVAGGGTQQFTASVVGTGSPAQTVTWAASAGTINGSGLFTAPAGTGVAQTINVTATSTVDGTKSGAATVTVPAAYSQYPAPGQVQAGVVYGNAGQFTGTLAAGSGGGGIGIMIGGVGVTQNGELVIGVS